MLDRNILKNITSLFSIRVATFVVPLITLPYLLRVLQPEGFGLLAFSMAVVRYAQIVVSYGFDLSATQEISRSENKEQISKIFWNVICARMILCVLCFPILMVVCNYVDSFSTVRDLIYIGYLSVFSICIYPQWLFQGKEELGTISIANVLFQFINIPLILIFVSSVDDLWVATLLSTIPSVITSVFCLIQVKRKGWVVWIAPNLYGVWRELKSGWHIFISTAAVSLYTSSVTVILGLISGPVSVAVFVSADKLLKAAQGMYTPISQSFYPRINALMKNDRNKAIALIRYLIKFQSTVTVFIGVGLYLFAPIVVSTLFGEEYYRSADILRMMCVIPILTGLSNVFGIQVLLSFGFKKEFSLILIFSGLVSLIILVLLCTNFGAEGAAVSVVISELLVALIMYIVILKKNIPLFTSEKN